MSIISDESMEFISNLKNKVDSDIRRAEQKNGVNARELDNLKKKLEYLNYAYNCMYWVSKVKELNFLLDNE